jgi:hypothetical protein
MCEIKVKTGRKAFWIFAAVCLIADGVFGQELIGPHGYLTFEAEVSNKDSVGKHGTFDLHHFNLFGDYLLSDKARVFGEIEFEHGGDSSSEPAESEAGDIRVERAWFEYAFSQKLKLQLGKILTPYGIYNEIHDAAPAYDTSILPVSIYGLHSNLFGQQQRFYAKFSLGVQALGKLELGAASLQYHLVLANGRGRQPYAQDDNRNKALGARLLAELSALHLKAGYSFYTEKNGLAQHTRQSSHAGDLRFEWRRWRVSSEFAHSMLSSGNAFTPNQVANGGYGELAYQLFDRQTILLRYDILDPYRRRSGDLERDVTIGTSVQIIRQTVVAKAEAHFWRVESTPRRNYTLGIASLAVVF